MRQKITRLLQFSVLTGLAAYIGVLLKSGKLSYYINARFTPLIILGEIFVILFMLIGGVDFLIETGVIRQKKSTEKFDLIQIGSAIIILLLAVLGFFVLLEILVVGIFFVIILAGLVVVMRGTQEKVDETVGPPNQQMLSSVILLIPFVLGFFVSAKPLETSSIQTKGITTSAAPLSSGNLVAIEKEAEKMDILDWLQAVSSLDEPTLLNGKAIDVSGFVYRTPELDSDQFMLSRFVMTCCAADAFAIGIIVEWPNAMNIDDNAWVEIEGEIVIDDSGDSWIITINASSVELISQPLQPYIFP